MRSIRDVGNQIINLIIDEEFRSDIERVQRNASFTSPELMFMRWEEMHDVLLENLPDEYTAWSELDFQIISIFSTKTVESLKEELLGN